MRTPPAPGAPEPHGDGSAETRPEVLAGLADYLETSFNSAGHTLSDPETAEVFTHTMRLVAHTLRGATAQGILSEEQRQEIDVLLTGMTDALRHV